MICSINLIKKYHGYSPDRYLCPDKFPVIQADRKMKLEISFLSLYKRFLKTCPRRDIKEDNLSLYKASGENIKG